MSAQELRRQTLAPPWFVDSLLRSESEQFWQVYLNNFMAGEVCKKTSAPTASQVLHEEVVESWNEHGALRAEEKHILAATDAVELGINIQGDVGLVGSSEASQAAVCHASAPWSTASES